MAGSYEHDNEIHVSIKVGFIVEVSDFHLLKIDIAPLSYLKCRIDTEFIIHAVKYVDLDPSSANTDIHRTPQDSNMASC